MKNVTIERKTRETEISLTLNVRGSGMSEINTGCGFLDHMLTLFASHGRFDLLVSCMGDTYVDYHHTVEDIGIVLGEAFSEALEDKRGITRYGYFVLPMDEALAVCAVDISGRAYLGFDIDFPSSKIGDFDTELVEEFWIAFCRSAGVTAHIRKLAGKNAHHIAEAVFKGMARAVASAVAPSGFDDIPSTKGTL